MKRHLLRDLTILLIHGMIMLLISEFTNPQDALFWVRIYSSIAMGATLAFID